ncbi:MAG: valine--tRNA ligase [Gemmatimonadota bacterium]|nr:valine--tRNA ligase [Gemmatimonadota bacterium]
MPSELSPLFDPASIERDVSARWAESGVFHARADRSTRLGGARTPFTIVIPPPNVTAVLHMGHGLNNTVQDVVVRWRRMSGDETLWVPGTDHAGIATQNVIERQLADEGRSRADLGRTAFVERTRAFVEETGGVILQQLQAIGCSCDWTRTAYTFSPELSRGVREAFVRLHEAGLIYRGHRVIHWCPRCLTSLSDEEAEHAEETGTLYHVRYPLADDAGRGVTVATTRPETMLGDVAVAVHPTDERYRDLVGRELLLPIANVRIPVIADEYVDREFGTGAVKITPAHDPNDFEMGLRHALPMPVIMAPDGTMAEGDGAAGRVPPALQGLDRLAARERVVALLRERGALVRSEPHQHAVRHCYRCDTVVEPRLSDQWFVRMKPLAEPALAGVRSGRVRILPERWEAVYINWLEGIRDWNISRQLWWGHRIPVWYCDACDSAPIVSRADVAQCPGCGGAVRQDDDVLDTWFSSWLWPLSTLGWPDETAADLRAFYPTDVLVTAPEILFFWVSRMIMAGYFFMGDAPFHTVYLHGTVRDMKHVKMSKSLGNGIDPLDVVALYGADALRYTVIAGLGMGTDVMLDPDNLEQSFAPGRNFATKLWNMGRFLLANVRDVAVPLLADIERTRLTRADEWILDRLDAVILRCDGALGPPRPPGIAWGDAELRVGLRLMEFTEEARRFTWDELAAWYLESTKPRLAAGGPDAHVARSVLVHTFDAALRLLHPVVPFITETLWGRLPGRGPGELLAGAAWPRPRVADVGVPPSRGSEFELVRESVSALRQIKADYGIPLGKSVEAVLVGRNGAARALEEQRALIGHLARVAVRVASEVPLGAAAHAVLTDGSEVIVPLAGAIDVEKECQKLRTELGQLETQLTTLQQRLANPGFASRAPAHVIAAEQAKSAEWIARRDQLAGKVRALCGD